MMPPPEFWWSMAGFTGWMGFLFCGFGWWGAVRDVKHVRALHDNLARKVIELQEAVCGPESEDVKVSAILRNPELEADFQKWIDELDGGKK